ncbi:4-hydroxy-3-methylbut-2-enyl diphosphate reductase [Bifidobacterium psychraerophilum]|uniref:4-hydroxy-3-methylbut-2-enyl diphosphate reductase n=1 Tax=Bifidobacterium psychraerophilum TaxID=218140 RepID=A0A087CDY5_9BIFI|nr:4-hydroxy-3-methylbut-2-enyl diphosphate reductase [Bifidobacterium psychraerophilum]KFI81485.1 4-hydroxy-3-methylbut-2-enyl diphosphate reductase [Bifidobacterium psychraerophilum]PKA95829.1 4-hydroxy-3-methylbut-2-enyl diphosphate reductase [Bifidobacterium psychraerophilum DSM 22366]
MMTTENDGHDPKRIVIAGSRGFCAGVDRAVHSVQTILDRSRNKARMSDDGVFPPVYVRREIVHNRQVVDSLAQQGAVFVQELDEIPDEAIEAGVPVVFSAHGVSPDVQREARERGICIVDATCPLVSKVHREVLRYVKAGYEIVYIGHRGHDEALGVIGESPEHVHLVERQADIDALDFDRGTKLTRLTQTTLSVDETADISAELHRRFPWIEEPPTEDICYATQNRQTAIKELARQSDCVIVVGSKNSSNSVRLVEVAQQVLDAQGALGQGTSRQVAEDGPSGLRKAHLLDSVEDLEVSWLERVNTVGISSGASVPEHLVQELVEALRPLGFQKVSVLGSLSETMHFALPSQLRSLPD